MFWNLGRHVMHCSHSFTKMILLMVVQIVLHYLFPAIHMHVAFGSWMPFLFSKLFGLFYVFRSYLQNGIVLITQVVDCYLVYRLIQRKLHSFNRGQVSRRIAAASGRQLFKCLIHFKWYINYKAKNSRAMQFT